MRLLALLVLAAAPLAGCYRYVPVSDTPPQGQAVRVLLAPPVDVRLSQVTANSVARVDGEVARAGADSLWLSASRLWSGTGYDFLGNNETVSLPRSSVSRLERREVDTTKTGLVIGASIVAAILAQFALSDGFLGSDGGNGGPGGQQ